MLRGKQNSKRRNWKRGNAKRKGRTKALTVLGVAGALSLAGSASGEAVGPPGDTLTANTAVTLHEEEISDVSLSTFYVFDRENAGARRPGLQLAKRTGSPGKVAEAAQKTAQAEAPHAALAAQPAAPAVDEAGRIDIAECRSHRTRCPPYR